MGKNWRRWLTTALVAVLFLVIVWQVFFYTEVGMAKTIGVTESRLTEQEFASLPQSVIDDAARLAGELVGSSHEKVRDLQDQLLYAYVAARDSDTVVIFNSGGWGWNHLEKTPGWNSIVEGVREELDGLGYKSQVLNYERASKGLLGCIRELVAMLNHYPDKARELAGRVEFLTSQLPDVRVIIAGESTGTILSDSTMKVLEDNERVYSIQTGTPFWHKPMESIRTLLMNSNGECIDTFSYGKVSTIVWASVKGWFGLEATEEDPGTILTWLRAPGHHYSWQYPGVNSAVTSFIDENFKAKNW